MSPMLYTQTRRRGDAGTRGRAGVRYSVDPLVRYSVERCASHRRFARAVLPPLWGFGGAHYTRNPGLTSRAAYRRAYGAGDEAIRRRGMILLVVLLIVSLLAILGATFAYRMRAELAAVSAQSNDLQAELAAEAGVERAKLILRQAAMERAGLLARTSQSNDEAWYDNREAFRQIIVWTPGQLGGKTSLDQHVEEGRPAWRFSVIAPREDLLMGGGQSGFRYGLIDEASKLNLNTATREQLIRLFEQLHLENVTPAQLADCLLDWREPGETPRELGAKTSYYQTLNPPYKCKGAPLESVEEVLLIKNFDGRILYGEDYNRNGHLDPNEDDGEDGLFPPDNGDGILNRGLYAFATVYSRDMNAANDNRARLNINTGINLERLPEEVRQIIEQEIPNLQEILAFVQQARSKGYKFESVAELAADIKIKKKPATRPATPGKGGARPNNSGTTESAGGPSRPNAGADRGAQGPDLRPPGSADDQNVGDNTRPGASGRRGGGSRQPGGDNKIQRRQQARRGGTDNDERVPTVDDLKAGRPDLDPSAFQEPGTAAPSAPGEQDRGGDAQRGPDDNGNQPSPDGAKQDSGTNPDQTGEKAAEDEEEQFEVLPTPVQPADMPAIMDRLTADPSPIQVGLINVNTAPREVLLTLPGLTEAEADAIVAARQALSADAKKTPAWLLMQGVVSPEKFAKIGKYITARSLQFTIESIGFADHVGTFRRLQVVVEMRGQVEQVLYWRDISALGIPYPLREDEWKNVTVVRNR